MSETNAPTDRIEKVDASPTLQHWKRTFADLAIGLCLAGMVLSPRLADAAPNKGGCTVQKECAVKYYIDPDNDGTADQCDVPKINGKTQKYLQCDGCNNESCPYSQYACACKIGDIWHAGRMQCKP